LTDDAARRSAHYVTPQWARVGNRYEIVCAGFNHAPESPVFRGAIEDNLFA